MRCPPPHSPEEFDPDSRRVPGTPAPESPPIPVAATPARAALSRVKRAGPGRWPGWHQRAWGIRGTARICQWGRGGQAASWTRFLCCRFPRGRLSEGAAGRQAHSGRILHSISGCLRPLAAGATRVRPEKWPSCRHLCEQVLSIGCVPAPPPPEPEKGNREGWARQWGIGGCGHPWGETVCLTVLTAAPLPVAVLAPEGQPGDPSERCVPLAMFHPQGSGMAMIHFSHH
ncbi:hypothetical protein HJG60_009210 [Phyllostomus discolor]|uniref:Uncharacterized protein n=1 Tax=Phyllostomus discolor TaxID=89673 RepID=A0A834DF48_9CHIR|nr:hypothetical protein HJG60_009210 [Phyllostomus discolor]